jgi:ribulose-phosphate 3-epimerase
MARPDANWLESLSKTRLIAEFSVWSADLGALRADLTRVEPHVDMLHIDVSDGHFTADLRS